VTIDLVSLATGGAAFSVLSAAARALPEPLPMGSRLYLFLYRFVQNLLSNFDKTDAVRSNRPQ
jgi:hypothetical protein